MPASKVQLIGGNFQDNEGNVLVNGYLKLRLSSDEQIPGVGQVCAGVVTTINLGATGSIDTSTPQDVWGNDQLVPANSFYIVEGFKANGQLAWGPNSQQVTGSGGTFDVGQWVPNTVISWTFPAALGPTGPTGSAFVGSTGPTGPTGTGVTGPTGPTGAAGSSILLQTSATMSAADIKGMWLDVPATGTPFVIVPAQGAGKAVVPLMFTAEYIPNTVAFDNPHAFTGLLLTFGQHNDLAQGQVTGTGFWDGLVGNVGIVSSIIATGNVPFTSTLTNDDLVIVNADATAGSNPTVGDGRVKITVWYSLLTVS